MAVGIEEALDHSYLEYRHATVRYLAKGLEQVGVPVMRPPGGHAVYIDARAFVPHIPPELHPGQAVACALYLAGGIRTCEIGSAMFGKVDPDGTFHPASMELVRLALPRRVYTQSHVDRVIEVAGEAAAGAAELRGLRMVHRPRVLPHFTAHFAPE